MEKCKKRLEEERRVELRDLQLEHHKQLKNIKGQFEKYLQKP